MEGSAPPSYIDRMTRALRFTLTTLALSWSLAALFHLAGFKWEGVGSLVGGVIYMWLPALVAMSLAKWVDREPLAEALGARLTLNRWWLVAAVLPGLMAVLAFGLSLLMPGASYDPSAATLIDRYADLIPADKRAEIIQKIDALPIPLFWLTLTQGITMGATLNLPATLGEELGWRGYLTRSLAGLGWLRASLIVGVIWGIWHAPLILMGHNYPQHPEAGVGMMVLFCAAVAPVIGWVRERAGTAWAAAVFHGTLNGTAGVAIVYVRGGDDLHVGVPGLAGILGYAALSAALALWSGRQGRAGDAA